tara:strand:+ start:23690 stop:25189 length:1500 start_codon:yes stop_codon:yes gene_type:complete
LTNTIYTYKNLSFKNTLIATLLFFIVSFIGVYFHELWMDESHHFLLSRDSDSFLDLFKNTRYDGHPILWNYLVYLITRWSKNPFYMQLMHIIISSTIAFIFLKKAPFKLWFKIAFLLSYFMLYEYTVISRNYNLGVLFLFLSCVLYAQREENFFVFCTFLALSCNTHSIFTIVTSALLFSVFLEQFFKSKKEILMLYWKGYLVFFIGIGIAFYQIIPPSDSLFFDHINYLNLYEASKSSMSFFKALFPVVDFTTVKYWNHFYFIEHFKVLSLIIGAVVWILPLLFFNKNRYVLIFIYTTLIGFVVFEIATRRYGVRYNGLLFVTLICGFWMLNSKKENPFLNKNLSKLNTKIIFFLMLLQAGSGVLAYSLDLKYTFNHGKNVANYIKEKKIDLNAIITVCESASINAFLEKNLYNLAFQRPQGYYLWNENVQSFYNQSDAQLMALGFDNKPQNHLYFIFHKPIKSNVLMSKNEYKITLAKSFENAVKENYYIYLIQNNE